MKYLIKKIGLLLSLITMSVVASAQIYNPVKWSFSAESINDKEGYVVITADIERGWHIYSQFIDDGGPIPTTFTFNKSADFKPIGKALEIPKAVSVFDKTFNLSIASHENRVVFKQKVAINKSEVKVNGSLEFMVCNDQQCLPPEDLEFSVIVKAGKPDPITTSTATPSVLNADSSSLIDTVTEPEQNTSSNQETNPISVKETELNIANTSLWGIFILGFLGGLLALIMPCIFPMLPLTVSFFTKKAGSKSKAISQAFIYGLSIVVIYVSLGLLITVVFGSDALNELASNGIFNFLFFALLVVFAISFFGAFEINLPSSWVNKIDAKSDKGGLLGIFFMAFALALVSFSCTGPIIGTLLVQAASMGELLGPAIGMLGFSIALAIPFTLFAAFPSLLKSLPKSGGWLNSVKVTLGFIELAFALKFLSNVDLAYHWDIFDREIFLVLWIVIFAMMGFYLLGKMKFSHDSDLKFITIPRLFLSILIFSFTIYMIPGLWGAPLKGISAWLPPQTTQDFDLYTNTLSSPQNNEGSPKKKYAGEFKAPHNLDAFFDYEQGLAYAKEKNKPVLIDFTGHTCVNCRKMEASVWSEKEVLNRLKNEYVLISLYVDDKTPLPANEQYVSKFSGKKVKTVGNKWSDFQASTFKTNSQPYYVIVGNDVKPLVAPQAFNLDVQNYIDFLDSGLAAFQNKK